MRAIAVITIMIIAAGCIAGVANVILDKNIAPVAITVIVVIGAFFLLSGKPSEEKPYRHSYMDDDGNFWDDLPPHDKKPPKINPGGGGQKLTKAEKRQQLDNVIGKAIEKAESKQKVRR